MWERSWPQFGNLRVILFFVAFSGLSDFLPDDDFSVFVLLLSSILAISLLPNIKIFISKPIKFIIKSESIS